jgi:hypothetical protein
MTFRSSAASALVLSLGVALAGCGKMNEVRAMKAYKDANKLYAANDYREAVVKYEEAIQLDPEDGINSCGAAAAPARGASTSSSAIPTTICIVRPVRASRTTTPT